MEKNIHPCIKESPEAVTPGRTDSPLTGRRTGRKQKPSYLSGEYQELRRLVRKESLIKPNFLIWDFPTILLFPSSWPKYETIFKPKKVKNESLILILQLIKSYKYAVSNS